MKDRLQSSPTISRLPRVEGGSNQIVSVRFLCDGMNLERTYSREAAHPRVVGCRRDTAGFDCGSSALDESREGVKVKPGVERRPDLCARDKSPGKPVRTERHSVSTQNVVQDTTSGNLCDRPKIISANTLPIAEKTATRTAFRPLVRCSIAPVVIPCIRHAIAFPRENAYSRRLVPVS